MTRREDLERRMRSHGFPRLGELQDWLRLFKLLNGWEGAGRCLQQQAYAAGVEPAVIARAVARITRVSWVVARETPLAVWLDRFRSEVGGSISCGGPRHDPE
jgi:hypothetical protein